MKKTKPISINIDEQLANFLKIEGIYDQFHFNVTKYLKTNNIIYRGEAINNITCAFIWKETPEGYDYWSDIDMKF